MEPREGDYVTDNLRLVRLIGRGGMGSVWVARHHSLDVDVAVKFVSKELLSGGDKLVVERFHREAKLAAKIESNHVVRIFDHGLTKTDGSPYIVMEFMRGESLAERIARLGRLAPGDAARIISEVANGLKAAHAIGIVHRDIKPHNVFLARARSGAEVAKLLDFGIAKTTNAGDEVQKSLKTSTGVLIGTPQYMSPEQLMHAGPPDAGADLWALGVVAYETVTGALPFAGATLAATLLAITRAEVTPPSATFPGTPSELDGFFKRALAADPARRFASAEELADAFAEAAGGMTPASIIPLDAETKRAPSLVLSPELTTEQFLAAEATAAQTRANEAGSEVGFAPTQVDQARRAEEDQPAELRSAATNAVSEVATKPSVQPPALAPEPRTNRTPWLVAGALVVAAGVGFVVTRKAPPPATPLADSVAATSSTSPAPSSVTSAAPSTSVVAVPSAAAVKAAPFRKQAVKEGRIDESRWVPDFWVQRDPAESGLGLLAAEAVCRQKGLSLCSDLQFERACATYPELGSNESWTFSSESGGFLQRGGAAGCSARETVLLEDARETHATLCCSRAVSLTGELRRFTSLRNASNPVLLYEAAFNAGRGENIAKNAEPSIGFFGQTLTSDKLTETVKWLSTSTFLFQDQCSLVLIPKDDAQGFWANCTGIELAWEKTSGVPKERKVIGVKQVFQRFEFAGSGKLRDVRTWQHPRKLLESSGAESSPPR